jgi:hypothetical protein
MTNSFLQGSLHSAASAICSAVLPFYGTLKNGHLLAQLRLRLAASCIMRSVKYEGNVERTYAQCKSTAKAEDVLQETDQLA